jgi:spermidine synthase
MPNLFDLMLAQRDQNERLLWHEEGVQTTVTILEHPGGMREMYMDGVHQAGDDPRLVAIHRTIADLGLLLHPNPETALVIGLGGGVTPGRMSRYEGVSIDVAELSESVVRGSNWLRHVNDDVLERPNVRLRIADGRNYLKLTEKRYDVIEADAIRPWHAGAGNLYSADFFRLVRDRLTDEGLMVHWNGGRKPVEFAMVLRTFLSVFPHTTLWRGDIMVGSKKPLDLDAAFQRSEIYRERGLDVSLQSIPMASRAEMVEMAGRGAIVTDDRPVLEYFRSLPRH